MSRHQRWARWLPAVLLLAGCARVIDGQAGPLALSDTDQRLIAGYFEHGNDAAHQGVDAQRAFLTKTQHPDFADGRCNLGGLTLLLDPTLSTLRPDDDWHPTKSSPVPRGRVYVVAVTVTVQRDNATLGTQIGSMHLAVLDDTAYGFAPCPS